jgi:hypothetical protein
MHRLMGFWRVQIRAQAAPDSFHLTKPNTFPSTIEKPASLRSDGDRDHPGMPFGFLSEQQGDKGRLTARVTKRQAFG